WTPPRLRDRMRAEAPGPRSPRPRARPGLRFRAANPRRPARVPAYVRPMACVPSQDPPGPSAVRVHAARLHAAPGDPPGGGGGKSLSDPTSRAMQGSPLRLRPNFIVIAAHLEPRRVRASWRVPLMVLPVALSRSSDRGAERKFAARTLIG